MIDGNIKTMLECYKNIPEVSDPTVNLLSHSCICEWQQQDEHLMTLLLKYPEQCNYRSIDEDLHYIICYVLHPGDVSDK